MKEQEKEQEKKDLKEDRIGIQKELID